MEKPKCILSFDVEWAPDWIVSEIAEGLAARGVKSTWFATHRSDLLSEMAGDPMFEVGLHPNFLPGSTQGGTEDEVLSAMLAWFPDAKCVRTHSLYQSEPLLQKMASSYGIEIDCSVFLPGCGHVEPHKVRWPDVSESLTRVPHVFQDNVHMGLGAPWRLQSAVSQDGGLNVFDFHPLHVLLNSRDMASYWELAKGKPYTELEPADLSGLIYEGDGVRTIFDQLVSLLSADGGMTIGEYVASWLVATDDQSPENRASLAAAT